ncbi:hypothetical protein KA082_01660 [Candidatus Woesebacteria bacterium]|nr:hypothetical protein [Candidatus Woesebacteria bacterium]
MNKAILRTLATTFTVITGFVATAAPALAAITNPATGTLGNNETKAQSGDLFVTYLVRIWGNIVTVAAILVLFYFVWGAIDWISGAGEKGKLEAARNKMMNAFIGLLILISTYTAVGFIGSLFFGTEFDILKPIFIFNL